MRKIVGTGLPVGSGVEVFHSKNNSGKKIIPANKEGLIFYMPFDAHFMNIDFDVSGKLNHATRYGAIHVDGKLREAVKFDGIDDYFDCGNNISLSPTNAITIMAWHHSTNLTRYGHPLRKRDQYTYFFNDNAYLYTKFYDTSGIHYIYAHNYVALGIEDNTWFHLVIVFTGYTTLVYIDGILKNERIGGTGGVRGDQGYNMSLGACIGGAAAYDGLSDEVKMYNRILSPEEILMDYQKEV